MEGGATAAGDFVAQQGRCGIDQAAFHPRGRCNTFTFAVEADPLAVGKLKGNGFERLPRKAASEVLTPAHIKPAICWPSARNLLPARHCAERQLVRQAYEKRHAEHWSRIDAVRRCG